jgi:hypothetical protein
MHGDTSSTEPQILRYRSKYPSLAFSSCVRTKTVDSITELHKVEGVTSFLTYAEHMAKFGGGDMNEDDVFFQGY